MVKKLVTLIAVIIVAGAGGAGLYLSLDQKPTPKVKSVQTDNSPISITIESDGNTQKFLVNNTEGKTALEATKMAVNGDISISGQGEMSFVTAIGGREVQADKKEFWEFLVNGRQAEVGAGTYIVQPGDIIVWRLNNY